MEQLTLYTIGHGERENEEFLDLLLAEEITTLIDLRANPMNQAVQHFNEPLLRSDLDAVELMYHWAGKQFGAQRQGLPESPNFALQNRQLRAYADYMMTPPFAQAVMQLLNLIRHGRSVIMGSEVSPERCHRSLIADYLVLQGVTVLHIIEAGEIEEHYLRPEARKESAALIYDRMAEATTTRP